jgi:hypothetical protein
MSDQPDKSYPRKSSLRPKRAREGAKDKLRKFLFENIGKVLHAYELREAAGGINEWARRVRELRQLEGYDIHTHNDDSSLKPGEYKLVSPKPRPIIESTISTEVRAFVLDRNGHTCQMCGAGAGEPHPTDPGKKTRLHIGHIIDLAQGGANDAYNLRALCSVCNGGAQNATLAKPETVWLLGQVRRAHGLSQLEVLKFLVNKFPIQADELLTDVKSK